MDGDPPLRGQHCSRFRARPGRRMPTHSMSFTYAGCSVQCHGLRHACPAQAGRDTVSEPAHERPPASAGRCRCGDREARELRRARHDCDMRDPGDIFASPLGAGHLRAEQAGQGGDAGAPGAAASAERAGAGLAVQGPDGVWRLALGAPVLPATCIAMRGTASHWGRRAELGPPAARSIATSRPACCSGETAGKI